VEISEKFYLVSKSPRRIELLSRFGYSFETVTPKNIEVSGSFSAEPEEVLRIAEGKLNSVDIDGVLLAADTLVFIDGIALGKPRSPEEARRFLKTLSGREHWVYTGVVIRSSEKNRRILEGTKVVFRNLKDDEIEWIIKMDETQDKAGGYAIQGVSGLFIERIEGCYFNVVGLPVPSIYPVLLEFGIKPSQLGNHPRD
jgi:septum formation protein